MANPVIRRGSLNFVSGAPAVQAPSIQPNSVLEAIRRASASGEGSGNAPANQYVNTAALVQGDAETAKTIAGYALPAIGSLALGGPPAGIVLNALVKLATNTMTKEVTGKTPKDLLNDLFSTIMDNMSGGNSVASPASVNVAGVGMAGSGIDAGNFGSFGNFQGYGAGGAGNNVSVGGNPAGTLGGFGNNQGYGGGMAGGGGI